MGFSLLNDRSLFKLFLIHLHDIIMKVIATTLAVVMSSILTTIVFGIELNFGFIGGAAIVMLGKQLIVVPFLCVNRNFSISRD